MFDQFTVSQALDDTLADHFECVHQMWHDLGKFQGCDDLHFNLLFEVVKYILLPPHSNAKEQISIVAKNKAKFRANLSVKTTFPNISMLFQLIRKYIFAFPKKFQPHFRHFLL